MRLVLPIIIEHQVLTEIKEKRGKIYLIGLPLKHLSMSAIDNAADVLNHRVWKGNTLQGIIVLHELLEACQNRQPKQMNIRNS